MKSIRKTSIRILCLAFIVLVVLLLICIIQPPPSYRREVSKQHAVYVMRCLKYAEQEHAASASTDLDADGTGEFVDFSEMSDEIKVECPRDFKLIAGRGYLEKVGYTFRIILPDKTDDRERTFFVLSSPNSSAKLFPLLLIMNEKGAVWEVDEDYFYNHVKQYSFKEVSAVTTTVRRIYP